MGKVAAAYCKPALLGRIKSVLKVADETFSSFIIGQCTEAVILGSLCILGMFIFRFPYAPMVGTFVGATALIPVVGAYLGAAGNRGRRNIGDRRHAHRSALNGNGL